MSSRPPAAGLRHSTTCGSAAGPATAAKASWVPTPTRSRTSSPVVAGRCTWRNCRGWVSPSEGPVGLTLLPGLTGGVRPFLVVHRPRPALQLRPIAGDQDRGWLAPDFEAVPRIEAAVPEHPECDPVAGREVLGRVVVALGPEADHGDVRLISSELLEARGLPGALASIR